MLLRVFCDQPVTAGALFEFLESLELVRGFVGFGGFLFSFFFLVAC